MPSQWSSVIFRLELQGRIPGHDRTKIDQLHMITAMTGDLSKHSQDGEDMPPISFP
ncbi:hypothetical protein BDV25DRAFT_164259 [Aspergillus avenaceus]|uniref:Uncharacterized protein n=1 Tax=Aspergillus avenaceus TaxID=36643 RepID=A0A5N6THK1_ASPAV|nr:hypothetical protein BDV25DRAFT_164259 [Aspergillus avenaceus]